MPAKGAQVGTTSRDTVPGTADEDVIVVGGGVTGTAIAWRAAAAGRGVLLIDPGGDDPRAGDMATMVAAGMLAPVSESVFGEQHLLTLNLRAAERFESFNKELEAAAGLSTGLRAEGTLAVAYDNGDLAALDRLTTFRRSLGLDAERLDARECRRLEPFLAPSTRGGVLTRGDHSVDNRRYLTALRVAAARSGVRIVAGTVTRVAGGEVRVALAGQPDGAGLTARHVIVSAGQATRSLDGVPQTVRRAVRPVKGQILRLRHPGGIPPVLRHSVRAVVQGRDLYLVPRQDGELVVGATQEEREDRNVTAGAVHELLRDAVTAVPAVSELVLAEASAGLRPGTSDNGPILGPAGQDGLIIATGHFRNGILLSAVTADAVTALLGGHPPDAAWAPFTPARFS
jgi:glycine oxidase